MRDYSKVSPKFWIGPTGKSLRGNKDAQIVAAYLMTSPHANMLGLYWLPLSYIAHETGIGVKGANKGLSRAIEAKFCRYDKRTEMVWVCEMAAYQIEEQLDFKDRRCLGIQREYDALPENPFLSVFFDRYAEPFHMTRRRGDPSRETSPSEGASKPPRSQEQNRTEQEQEHEQAQEQEQNNNVGLASDDASVPASDPVQIVFDHWGQVHEHPRSKLDAKRRRVIREALKTYTSDELCESISGYRQSSWHMGDNDRHRKYDDIELMLRDSKRIDQGLAFARTQPHPKLSELTRKNLSNTEGWVPPEMRRAAS